MTRDEIIRMAREAGMFSYVPVGMEFGADEAVEVIERFAALVAAAEREECAKRRGTLLFNPYAGTPRHPSDIASDPHGILMLDPDEPIRARGEK